MTSTDQKNAAPGTLAKLLRAIAAGSDARASRHDIIFNAAADALDRLLEGQKASRNFMAQLVVAENGASLNGNVTVREQTIPARIYDAALKASQP